MLAASSASTSPRSIFSADSSQLSFPQYPEHGGQTDQAYDIKGVDGAKLLVDAALRGFDKQPHLEEAPVRVALL